MTSVPSLHAAVPVSCVPGSEGGGGTASGPIRHQLREADPGVTPLTALQALDQALAQTASARFPDRTVEVTTFHDEASGRDVCRVTDRGTGALVAQTPPDELLRFFASARAEASPLLALEV